MGSRRRSSFRSENLHLEVRGMRPIQANVTKGVLCEQAEGVCVKGLFPLVQASEGLAANRLGSAWSGFSGNGVRPRPFESGGSLSEAPNPLRLKEQPPISLPTSQALPDTTETEDEAQRHSSLSPCPAVSHQVAC